MHKAPYLFAIAIFSGASSSTFAQQLPVDLPYDGYVVSGDIIATARPLSLDDALLHAFETNPELAAIYADQMATDEDVAIAIARGRPRISSTLEATSQLSRGYFDLFVPRRQASAGVELLQPIFSGGEVRYSVQAARKRAEAGDSIERAARIELFRQVATVYADVQRDEEILALNRRNVQVLETNLSAASSRFKAGDLTRTDVQQSEARLELAKGQLYASDANVIASRERFLQIVGMVAGPLLPLPTLPGVPTDQRVAEQGALRSNPDLEAMQLMRDARRADVGVAKAARLPRASIGLSGNYRSTLGSLSDTPLGNLDRSGFGSSLLARVSVPLFQGGAPAAGVRQSRAREAAAVERVTLTQRRVIGDVRTAFARYRSARSVTRASELAVSANKQSLAGVRAENAVGTRSILDILNAEQELLGSQVELTIASRDAFVQSVALLVAIGAENPLQIPGALVNGRERPDPRTGWSDWADGEPIRQVGTSTIDNEQQPMRRAPDLGSHPMRSPETSDPGVSAPS